MFILLTKTKKRMPMINTIIYLILKTLLFRISIDILLYSKQLEGR